MAALMNINAKRVPIKTVGSLAFTGRKQVNKNAFQALSFERQFIREVPKLVVLQSKMAHEM